MQRPQNYSRLRVADVMRVFLVLMPRLQLELSRDSPLWILNEPVRIERTFMGYLQGIRMGPQRQYLTLSLGMSWG